MSRIINWAKLFKSKGATESQLSIMDNDEQIKTMRTIELSLGDTNFFVIPDVYTKKDGKVVRASKEATDRLIDDNVFDSFLNNNDKRVFKDFITRVFDFEDLVQFKKQ